MANETRISDNGTLPFSSTILTPTTTSTYESSTTVISGVNQTITSSGITTSTADVGSTTWLTAGSVANHSNQTYFGNTTGLYISDEDRYRYLEYLQERTTNAMIPAMTYLIILATVGLVGNSLVLFVYSRKFKQTSTRVFIMAIATFDIVTNVVAMPAEIYDMFHIWDFDKPLICKTRLFFNAFTTMVAAKVLVAVAVVRYRKICNPFKKQVTVKMARIVSVTLAVTSLIFSVPYAIINGRQTKATPRDGIKGYECTIDDTYVKTIWPTINGAFFIFLFVVCCIPLVVMYILIGVTAWKHSKVYGVVSYSTGKNEAKSSDSGNSNDASTKTTDDTPLKFTKTPKTRSFVKKKGEPSSTLPSASDQKDNKNKGICSNNEIAKNQGSCNNDKSRDDKEGQVDVDAIEYVDDKGSNDKSKNTTSVKTVSEDNYCSIRTIRSPTGQQVQINMLMVRELTVKLRAVKKETEDVDNDDTGSDPWKAADENKTFSSSDKLIPDISDKSQIIDKESVNENDPDNVNKEDCKRFSKAKIYRNKSADNKLYEEIGKARTGNFSKRFSKSVDDLCRLTARHKLVKELAKSRSAENEDLDLRGDTNGLINQKEATDNEEPEASQDEPVSEFAKAMQWVDLTYCLKEDNKDNESTKNEVNVEEIDGNSLTKKGSFAISRKISRDNSFLQRHRKLKDALTDTLTRARRSRKEREASETEARNSNGIGTLENINSENENTCNNDDSDSLPKDRERKDSRIGGEPRDDKAVKRKASRAKEDMSSHESAIKIVVDKHRAKRRGVGRTTCMLILISAVYILGFLPFLGLMFAKNASPGTFESMDLVSLALYNLFLRSYFLNSAANPIIYSLCDINFRRECFALVKWK